MDIVAQANGIAADLECGECSWQTFCIKSPTMTEEEVQVQRAEARAEMVETENAAAGLLRAFFFIGKDTDCGACRVFIARLRESPRLSVAVKKLMQEWDD